MAQGSRVPAAAASASGFVVVPAPPSVPLVAGAVFIAIFVAMAWAPHDRGDWLLENLISAPVATFLLLARRRTGFSTMAWISVFSFLALHEIGSHYTYSRVPWREWSDALVGWAPAGDRNPTTGSSTWLSGSCSRCPWRNSSPGRSLGTPRCCGRFRSA